jgi:hypothetical protein
MRPMSESSGDEFVLEISGAGESITLDPVGTIDFQGARAMLDVLDSLRNDRHGVHLAIRLDRMTGMTPEARRMLAARGLPVDTPLAGVG